MRLFRFAVAVSLLVSIGSAQSLISGSGKIQLDLAGLQTVGNVLMIGAHPDDENTALLAYLARGRHLRTAYLSLTRGEGGQNLIGTEQGELMGVLRTQELLDARAVDVAEQFFSRAIDFGFSKTSAESLAKWDREKVLGDAVYVIRHFQPDIIILRFSGTPADGHGQHQASAILGKEAYAAAADPARFPEQLSKGVRPWKAKRLLINVPLFTPQMRADAEKLPGKIGLDLGVYDPLSGYSFGEVAAISRSQHRSQAMGSRLERGTMREYFVTVAGESAAADILDGVDTSWRRVPNGGGIASLLDEAVRNFSPRHPEKSIPALLEVRRAVKSLQHPARERKLAEIDEVIAECLGLFLDASAAGFYAVPGSKLPVRLMAVNRSPVPVELRSARIGSYSQNVNKTLAQGNTEVLSADLDIPGSQPFTRQYWLEKPALETMYALDDVQMLRYADQPPALSATFALTVAGEPIELVRPVHHRYVDRIYGELTRPLVFTPPAAIALSEKAFLFPTAEPRAVAVQVTAMQAGVSGTVKLAAPVGWKVAPASHAVTLAGQAQQVTVQFTVTPPQKESTGELAASIDVNGREFALAMTSIEYPHIPAQTVFRPAMAKAVRADVAVLSKRIGYVMGAGDEVPQALRQIGCEVTLLSPEALAAANLSQYDAIVTGIRAFNTRPDLRANIERVYDFARAGGTVIVQYNVQEGGFGGGNPRNLEKVGPYPLTTSNRRVTVEDSPVEFLATHPLLTKPNRITARDFDGWVQERGLYFASGFDNRYTSLFTMHDPGEEPLQGGTLYAPLGKGAYIFTPLAWFRQLPNGVPGAFRIFANFLSAGKGN